ncbi:MAG: hypothetical protein KME26_09310 [Oscillatoria princeps RMCB-10]|jgi:hypothetical protein|nr:hypothetical protein [Oscillatoria princeps RMCB-10]
MLATIKPIRQPDAPISFCTCALYEEVSHKVDSDVFKVYFYVKTWIENGDGLLRLKVEDLVDLLGISEWKVRKALRILKEEFGYDVEPVRELEIKSPDYKTSPAPTPSSGKRTKPNSVTENTPPAPAAEPPQPELATMSDAPAQPEPAAENTPPAPAAEPPQPELATMSDAPAQPESLTENTPPAPPAEPPQPELATMSDAPAQPESPAQSSPPAPAAESQQPEIYIYKESESPELPETAVQAQQEVGLSPETASVEQVLETQNPEAGMSATPEEEQAQTTVELEDAPHPAEEEAAPSPMVGTDSGPSAGGSQTPAEHKPQVMQELREKFLAAPTLAVLKQIKAAYGDEISNAVWHQLAPEEKEKIRAIVQRDSQEGAQAEEPAPAPAPAPDNPAGPPPKQAEEPAPAPAPDNPAGQRLKRGMPVQIWRRGFWGSGYQYVGPGQALANNERTGQLEIAHLVQDYSGDLFEVAENNIRFENSA